MKLLYVHSSLSQILQHDYELLPPLTDVYEQLLRTKRGGPSYHSSFGIFELHEATDYVDMGYHIQLLAAALCDVDGYVAMERMGGYPVPVSPSKSGSDFPESPLQLVKMAIEALHDKIGGSTLYPVPGC